MKYVINNQVVLSRPPEGPLAAYIVSFAESLREQGYGEDSVYRQVLLAACFSQWLEQIRVEVHSISLITRYGIYDIALTACEPAWGIVPRSVTSLIFCAVRA